MQLCYMSRENYDILRILGAQKDSGDILLRFLQPVPHATQRTVSFFNAWGSVGSDRVCERSGACFSV